MSDRGQIDDLQDLFDNAPCGYLVLRADGRIHRLNRTLATWTGFSCEELEGKHPHDLLNIAGKIFYETHVAPLLRMQGFFHEVALDLVTKADERLPVIANAVEHRDPQGRPVYTRIAFLKATDRRRYERELLNARTKALENLHDEREMSELREQFIAVLGHDLRNPLASISAGVRILLRGPKDETESRVLVMMQSTVIRMADLISNVLDFARGRLGGGISLNRDHTRPLEPVLHQVVDELRSASPDRLIETEFAIDRNVDCDKTRIGQLVSNLVGNALTHGAPDRPVRVHASTTADNLVIWVANSGPQIPETAMGRLFQPFFRGEVRASRQGLGLGLFIATQIAEAHGGTLTARSSGEETRFIFRMPSPE